MLRRGCRVFAALAIAGLWIPAFGEPLTFEGDIRPILRAHCYDCHGAEEELSGGLDLRLVRLMEKGGESGPAITAGDTASSYLLDRVRSGEMPPGSVKVSDAEQEVLARWIAEGAKVARPEPESLPPGLGITPEERAFWSFQPVRRPAVPSFTAADGVRTPIDAFLLRELKAAGLGFAAEAERAALIRRLTIDLVGLPPTHEEVAAFVSDESPDAYGRLVERLLASPHYGERWARHWLDVAGYADSDGYVQDTVRAYAWKYRDYVVHSLNGNKPFDAFVIEQLAGDELVPARDGDLTAERIEALTATGFLRLAADGTAGAADPEVARNQVVADTIKIVSTSLLGLSVGCAQCHDHRYDPIPQADYYRLRSVFEPALDWKQWRSPGERLVSLSTAAERARAEEIEKEAQVIAAEREAKQAEFLAAALEMELQKHPAELREKLRAAYQTPADKRTPEQVQLLAERPSVNITPGVLYQYDPKAAEELKKYDARIAEVRAKKPVVDYIAALTEPAGHAPLAKLFHRGDHRQPKGELGPGGLSVTAPEGESTDLPADDPNVPTTGRRLAFARRLTSGTHPLVARVLVNRVWMHHFGRGLVETPAEFGKLGERPTHPELLDWLADEFVSSGRDVKHLHRLIVLSAAYRQSSARTPAGDAADSDGRLYSRFPMRRVDAEVVRDALLAASGALDRRLYGSPTPVKEDEAGRVVVEGKDVRRSLYLQVRRTQPLPFLASFDAPVMEVNCERRASSTVATQSLMLMNGEFLLAEAGRMAARVRSEANEEPPSTVDEPMVPAVWQFGIDMGEESPGGSVRFQPLPHWTGSTWQGGSALPDAALGWALLHAGGGHTGERHPVVRRWTAPQGGVIGVRGTLKHASPNGDGVRGRLVSSRSGPIAEWVAQAGETATDAAGIVVERGDTLDFVTDCRESVTSDSFEWIATLELRGSDGVALGTWESSAGFRGASGPPLAQQVTRAWRIALGRAPAEEELRMALDFLGDEIAAMSAAPDPVQGAMTNLCQSLLGSNEFLYVE